VVPSPLDSAVEVGTPQEIQSEPVAGHRQEEEVEGIGCTVAGLKALLQSGDGKGELAGAILGDAQRIEVIGLSRGQRDRLPGQVKRLLRIA
jgi:hypothetical protein